MSQEKYPIPRKQPAYFSALNTFIDTDATLVQRANSRLVFERIADRWDGFRATHGKTRVVKTPEQKEQVKRAKRDREFAQSHIWDAIIGSDQVVPELKAAALRQKRALQQQEPQPGDSRASPPLKKRRVQEQSDNDDNGGGGGDGGNDDGEYEDDEPVSENSRRVDNDGNADNAASDEQTDREQQRDNEPGRHVETFEDSDQSSEPFVGEQQRPPQSTAAPPITQPWKQMATNRASNGVQTRSRARAIRQQLRKKVPVKALENLKKKFNELAKAMDISRDEDIVKTFEEMFQLALNQTKVIDTVDEIVAEIEE